MSDTPSDSTPKSARISDTTSDLQRVESYPIIDPFLMQSNEVVVNMSRQFILRDKEASFAEFHIDLPDNAFLIRALSNRLLEDIETINRSGGLKVLGYYKNQLSKWLDDCEKAIQRAKTEVESLSVWKPPTDNASSDDR